MNDKYLQAIARYAEAHGGLRPTPRALLFDMDGVLFDSMPLHARSWSEVCAKYGLPMRPLEAFMHEGRTGASTINILSQRHRHRDATPEEVAEIYADKCALFNTYPAAPKMAGAEQLLAKVRADGLTIVVVTGSGQATLLRRLQTNFPGFFAEHLVVSSKDVKHGKPDPEPYLMGLAKAGVAAHEALVVENAPLGVKAAHAAGIFTIAVNTGPLPPEALTEEGADLLLPSMQALAEAWPCLYHTLRQNTTLS